MCFQIKNEKGVETADAFSWPAVFLQIAILFQEES